MSVRSRHDPSDTEDRLSQEYLQPYFMSKLADKSRCVVLTAGDNLDIFGLKFNVYGTDPPGYGIIDANTTIFAAADTANEFSRIHVVPFSDTLPSAYNFDIFGDYVRPFFAKAVLDRFTLGQTFLQNGVQFKVVATDPVSETCRVGDSTEIFCEGCLHPTAQNLLSPDQASRLSAFPPGLQMLLLNSDMFGDGTVAERIIRAQERHQQVQQSARTQEHIQRATRELTWSPELVSELRTEQTECVVCLSEFQDGDRIRALQCDHIFHADCVDEWLGRDSHCPLCRNSFVSRQQSRRR